MRMAELFPNCEYYENAEIFTYDEILEAIRNFSKDNRFYDIAKKAQILLDKYGSECQTAGYLFFNKSQLKEYFPKYLWKYFREEPFSDKYEKPVRHHERLRGWSWECGLGWEI